MVLERTPPALNALLRHLPEPWTDVDEGPTTWSPFQVVGHLIHGERVDWIPRGRQILERGDREAFEPFDRFAHLHEFAGRRLSELLDLFASLRQESLETLRGWRLTEADLARKGRHPELGPVTLRQLLATWVAHDLGHLAQITRVMAKRYRDDVGPWEAYIPVLHR